MYDWSRLGDLGTAGPSDRPVGIGTGPVRELREKHGLTQEQLATEAGVPLEVIQRWEREEALPPSGAPFGWVPGWVLWLVGTVGIFAPLFAYDPRSGDNSLLIISPVLWIAMIVWRGQRALKTRSDGDKLIAAAVVLAVPVLWVSLAAALAAPYA